MLFAQKAPARSPTTETSRCPRQRDRPGPRLPAKPPIPFRAGEPSTFFLPGRKFGLERRGRKPGAALAQCSETSGRG